MVGAIDFLAVRVSNELLDTECIVKVEKINILNSTRSLYGQSKHVIQQLTPTTDKMTFDAASQIIPLPLISEYGSSTVLIFKVIGLIGLPVSE